MTDRMRIQKSGHPIHCNQILINAKKPPMTIVEELSRTDQSIQIPESCVNKSHKSLLVSESNQTCSYSGIQGDSQNAIENDRS